MATRALLNDLQQSSDKKRLVSGIICDLQKAFDCVNHNTFLEKNEIIRDHSYSLQTNAILSR